MHTGEHMNDKQGRLLEQQNGRTQRPSGADWVMAERSFRLINEIPIGALFGVAIATATLPPSAARLRFAR